MGQKLYQEAFNKSSLQGIPHHVFLTLSFLCDDNTGVLQDVTQTTLAEASRCSPAAVSIALRVCKAAGYVNIKQQGPRPAIYTIL